jgi:hypothetical protein
MFAKEMVPQVVANNIRFDTSVDGKYIRLTTYAFGKKDPIGELEESQIMQPEEKGIQRLVKSIFGKKRR